MVNSTPQLTDAEAPEKYPYWDIVLTYSDLLSLYSLKITSTPPCLTIAT